MCVCADSSFVLCGCASFVLDHPLQSQWAVEEQTPPSPDEVGITCLDFSPDSSMVLCGGIDCAAHLININNNRVLWKLGRKGNSAGKHTLCYTHGTFFLIFFPLFEK